MTPDQLQAMNLTELKTLAGESGVAKSAQMRREELIQALLPRVSALAQPGAPVSRPALAPQAPSSSPSSMVAQQPATSHGPEHGLPIPERYGRDRLVLMV